MGENIYLGVVSVTVPLPTNDGGEDEADHGNNACADDTYLSKHGESSEPAHDSPVTTVVMMTMVMMTMASQLFHITIFIGKTGAQGTI